MYDRGAIAALGSKEEAGNIFQRLRSWNDFCPSIREEFLIFPIGSGHFFVAPVLEEHLPRLFPS